MALFRGESMPLPAQLNHIASDFAGLNVLRGKFSNPRYFRVLKGEYLKVVLGLTSLAGGAICCGFLSALRSDLSSGTSRTISAISLISNATTSRASILKIG